MAHKLITIPNAILRSRSKRIGYVDDSIKQLAEEMSALTLDWDHDSEFGVALAAIQVGQPLRLAVIREEIENGHGNKFSTLINPEIVKLSDAKVADIEGCLSVPNIYGRVNRHLKVKIKAIDFDGKPIRVTAEGFIARVFQHEIDHMNGILFLDHIQSSRDLYSIDEQGKLSPLVSMPKVLKDYV